MALKGLIIRKPWIDLILSGEKTWEMRSRGTTVRGPIPLIEQGSGLVVGIADLTDSLSPLKSTEVQTHFAKHKIPQSMVMQPGFNWFTPWVVSNACRLSRPISYQHKSGAVIWVTLDTEVESAVRKLLHSENGNISPHSPPPQSPNSDHVIKVRDALADVRRSSPKLNLPLNVNPSVTRNGNQLHICVEWDEKPQNKNGKWANFVNNIFAR